MRLKHRYKSCLWTKTNIWGTLLAKEGSFLRPKWDGMISILRGQRRRHRPLVNIDRYRHRLCHDYSYMKPRSRANQIFKYNRLGYRNTLSLLLCIRRFYGDLGHKSFKKVCFPLSRAKHPSNSLLNKLESRLDVCLYRLGFFHSIYYSRQAILHNKVLVNGKRIENGSFTLQKGDLVEFCPKHRLAIKARLVSRYKHYRYSEVKLQRWRLLNKYKLELHLPPTPKWVQTDYSNLSFVVASDINLSVHYPFRPDFDEAIWSSRFGYF